MDELVRDGEAVVTLMDFWFPLKNDDNYNSYTRWDRKGYNDLDDLLSSGDVDYVVMRDYLVISGTATSGRRERSKEINHHGLYYNKVNKFATENGGLVAAVRTNNYGNREIWEMT